VPKYDQLESERLTFSRASIDYFALTRAEAESIVAEVALAVRDWRRVAVSPEVGLEESELEAFSRAGIDSLG
jgi:hypothetical protein